MKPVTNFAHWEGKIEKETLEIEPEELVEISDRLSEMAGESRPELPAKWDACLDLGLRRFVYSSLAGAVSGFLIFREH